MAWFIPPSAGFSTMWPRSSASGRTPGPRLGIHGVHTSDVTDVDEMVANACWHAVEQGFAAPGQRLVVTAGMPFGTPGRTNLLRVAWIED